MNIKCEICGKIFTRKSSLKTHLAAHEKIRLKYPCAFCEKKLSNLFNLKTHYNGQHPNENMDTIPDRVPIEKEPKNYAKNYNTPHDTPECDICSKVFARIQNLKDHIYDVHLGIRKLGCKFCKKNGEEKIFGRKSDLLRHIKKFHPSYVVTTTVGSNMESNICKNLQEAQAHAQASTSAAENDKEIPENSMENRVHDRVCRDNSLNPCLNRSLYTESDPKNRWNECQKREQREKERSKPNQKVKSLKLLKQSTIKAKESVKVETIVSKHIPKLPERSLNVKPCVKLSEEDINASAKSNDFMNDLNVNEKEKYNETAAAVR